MTCKPASHRNTFAQGQRTLGKALDGTRRSRVRIGEKWTISGFLRHPRQRSLAPAIALQALGAKMRFKTGAWRPLQKIGRCETLQATRGKQRTLRVGSPAEFRLETASIQAPRGLRIHPVELLLFKGLPDFDATRGALRCR